MPKISKLSLNQMMIWVILAALPALIFMTWWQSWGFLINLSVGLSSALIFESLFCFKRGIKVEDLTPAFITAVLLCAGIPSFAPWWIPIVGTFFAIIIAKHLFGGLGHNIFNPAMVGYAILLVAFPKVMIIWPAWATDAISAATPLDHVQSSSTMMTIEPWLILNACWLLGGLILLYKKIITWVLPTGFLVGMLTTALFFSDPLLQLGLGSTMIGAFFIITDPVTAPATPKIRFFYAFVVGLTVILMRQYSHYPDGLAFAIILGNACVPLLDEISQRTRR